MKNKFELSPKAKSTIRVKRTLVYASVGAAIFLMLFIGVVLYLNLGNSEQVIAGNPGYTSRNNQQGLWSESTTWIREGWVWDPTPARGQGGITIDIYGVVTDEVPEENNTFNYSGGNVLNIIDTLIIKGNFTASGGTRVNITSTGVLIVYGTLTVSANVTNNGRLVVTEDVVATGGSRLTNNSNGLYVFGSTTKPQWENNFSGNGFKNQNSLRGDYINQNYNENLYEYVENGGIILLPIVLDYFTAEMKLNKSILVEWGTVSEVENDFFTLERSIDGKNFEAIARIEGAENSNKKQEYNFLDDNPAPGFNYYRLKQTDYNGDFEYFKIIGVNNENHSMQATSPTIRELYPNPLNGEVSINFETANAGSLELTIQNIQGETKLRKTLTAAKGANTFKVNNLDQLQPGVYFLRLNLGEQFSEPHRIIKL